MRTVVRAFRPALKPYPKNGAEVVIVSMTTSAGSLLTPERGPEGPHYLFPQCCIGYLFGGKTELCAMPLRYNLSVPALAKGRLERGTRLCGPPICSIPALAKRWLERGTRGHSSTLVKERSSEPCPQSEPAGLCRGRASWPAPLPEGAFSRPDLQGSVSGQRLRHGVAHPVLHRPDPAGGLRSCIATSWSISTTSIARTRSPSRNRISTSCRRSRFSCRFSTSNTSSTAWSSASARWSIRARGCRSRCSTTRPTRPSTWRAAWSSAMRRWATTSFISIAPIARATRRARSTTACIPRPASSSPSSTPTSRRNRIG